LQKKKKKMLYVGSTKKKSFCKVLKIVFEKQKLTKCFYNIKDKFKNKRLLFHGGGTTVEVIWWPWQPPQGCHMFGSCCWAAIFVWQPLPGRHFYLATATGH
jgi:hypothetical protein